ncbi:glycosyltransferase [Novosphingobium sp. 17-62-19]|uniref:glycosyltransferase n=1 Tax=Novosphingobium sp. 17-62-19 TaxID=1970406 RepID=UPI0025DB747A|nr:glycosyltransferase [Novosphingobium sp. 17-62-19]HQS95806.1 glycosyltransferase [Novosphingobium sp.]
MPEHRIKVAFLLPHFRPGGAERVVLNWLGALDRSRFDPHLLLGRVEGDFLDLLPRDVEPLRIGANRALWRSFDIGRQLDALGIDVAYSATNAMNLALMAAPARNCARIVSEHTTPTAYLAGAKWPWLRKAAMRLLYPSATAVAVPTQAIAAELNALMRRELPIRCLPNPVIDDWASQTCVHPSAAVRTGPWQIVSAGRLVREKGFDLLIAAVGKLARHDRPCQLTIYGEGPERAKLEARIVAEGLNDHVRLAGHVADPGAAMAGADLFVLASRREGFGNVLIEAMHQGLPVLATRCGGPDSFISDGDNGWLVPTGDAQVLAARIEELLADPARLTSTVGAGRATAAQYGIQRSTRMFEKMLVGLARR